MNNEKKYRQYGYRIAQARTKAGLMQKDVAKHLGVKDNVISYFENGDRLPSVEQYKELSKLFNVSADYLLGLATDFTTDDKLKFVCNYTGLSADAINNLKDSVIYGDLCSNELICLEAIRENSNVYFECKNDLLQSETIKQIISCIVYEKLLYKNLSELKRRVDSNEMKDDFDTHNLTMKVLKWKNQHKINLFNAQDSLMNFVKGYTPLEKIDKNLYDSLVTIATTYTPFENEQKERDEFENRCKSYGLYFALEGDNLNGNDN